VTSRTLAELAGKVVRVSDTYATECAIKRDDDWHALKLQEECGELVKAYLRCTGRTRDNGMSPAEASAAMADEAADLLAHVLLFCQRNGIDIDSALDRKWFRYLDNGADR
jgi:NTP pyrophosphatase (non-canonical NTP hydrolase)